MKKEKKLESPPEKGGHQERKGLDLILKIVGAAALLVGAGIATQKAIRRHKRHKFITQLIEKLFGASAVFTAEEIKEKLFGFSIRSKEAQYIFESYIRLRRAIAGSSLTPDDRDFLQEAFSSFLREYCEKNRIPKDRVAKILNYNLEKLVGFGQ